jgi:hypothetical protein
MEFRYLEHNDYDTLKKWWKDNRFPPPPRDFLPNNGLDGIIVSENGVDICSGFIYDTSAKYLAWIEYVVSNFEVKDRELRKKALEFLIKSLMDICKNMGKKYIYTSLKNESLINHFENSGFIKGSSGTTEMVCVF